MFRRILVLLDGSKQSEQAIPVAARLARESGGMVIFVYVTLPLAAFDQDLREPSVVLKPGAFRRREEEALRYLERVTLAYESELNGIRTEIDLTMGAAAPEIYSATNLEKIDVIVVCCYGEGDLERWVFGCLAREDSRHRPVSVLVLNEAGEITDCKDITPLCAYWCREWSENSISSLGSSPSIS